VPERVDVALAERCRTDAPGAFEELYRAHSPRLFGLACRMVGRPDAEDLLQEIFLSAYRKMGQYRGDSALGTWLFRLATNLCVDHLRSRGAKWSRMTDELPEEPPAAAPGSGSVLGAIDRMDLDRALLTLPDGCRTVFVLHDVEGFEHHEIGTLLGIADGTSKSQLHKARRRLREALTENERR
jgi:RNA polymerase sigma-70 factor (ECF subfamily)